MEGVMVSAATGALNSILEKLGTLLVQEYNLQKGVHGNGDNIQRSSSASARPAFITGQPCKSM